MKKSTLLTLACLLLCAACADEEEVSFPLAFSGGELVPKYEIRVYTEGGRRIEGPEAEAFLGGTYSGDDDFSVGPPDGYPADPFYVRFREPEYWIESVRFEDAHTLSVISKNGTYGYELRRQGDVLLAGGSMDYYMPLFDYQRFDPEVPAEGDPSDCMWVPRFVIRGGYLSPHFSLTCVKAVVHTEYGLSTYADGVYNEFDESLLETLAAGDTIAVREYYVRFPR